MSKKNRERMHAGMAFGFDVIAGANDSEAPDLLLNTAAGTTLGVEVTSLFASEAEAKLRYLDGYAEDLIDKVRLVHLADQGVLEVNDIKIVDADNDVIATMVGIKRPHPSDGQLRDLLQSVVSKKAAKIDEYLVRCDAIDLVVFDEDALFRRISDKDGMRLIIACADTADLMKTRFREVHLITSMSGGRVRVPLIGAAFVANCLAFQLLIADEVAGGFPEADIADLMLSCLHRQGNGTRVLVRRTNSLGITCGAWEMHYDDDGGHARDWTLPHERYGGVTLEVATLKVPANIVRLADLLVAKRQRLCPSVGMAFPAHEKV